MSSPPGFLRGLARVRELQRGAAALRRTARDEEAAAPRTASAVAIIMDGNGRWARRRRLPRLAGHRAGTRALRRTVEAAPGLGVRSLAVYAFSTENWGRPHDEVSDLMELFAHTIVHEFPELDRQGVRIRFVGRRDRCSERLAALMEEMEARTAGNRRLDLWVAFDYGARDEIVHAARRLAEDGLAPEEVDEEAVRARLYAPAMPDPDLVIRTSGELRVSNFFLWQMAYAELHFTRTLWPDFGGDDLREALDAYAGRRRRFGRR
jgi:undecaprenyl diphosphate synthase